MTVSGSFFAFATVFKETRFTNKYFLMICRWEMGMSDFGLFAIEIISVSACVPSLALCFQNDPSRNDGSWFCFHIEAIR